MFYKFFFQIKKCFQYRVFLLCSEPNFGSRKKVEMDNDLRLVECLLASKAQ